MISRAWLLCALVVILGTQAVQGAVPNPYDGKDRYKIRLVKNRQCGTKEFLGSAAAACSAGGPALTTDPLTDGLWNVAFSRYAKTEGKFRPFGTIKQAVNTLCKGYLQTSTNCYDSAATLGSKNITWKLEEVKGVDNAFFIVEGSRSFGCKRYLSAASSSCSNNKLTLLDYPTELSKWQFIISGSGPQTVRLQRKPGETGPNLTLEIRPPTGPGEWPVDYEIRPGCKSENGNVCPAKVPPPQYPNATLPLDPVACWKTPLTGCTPPTSALFVNHQCGSKYTYDVVGYRAMRTYTRKTSITIQVC